MFGPRNKYQKALAAFLDNVSTKGKNRTQEYMMHNFENCSSPADHDTEINFINGMPDCPCYCCPVCDIQENGIGIIIHNEKNRNKDRK